jgi:hypothetical protein
MYVIILYLQAKLRIINFIRNCHGQRKHPLIQ